MPYQPRIDEHGNECCTHTNADGTKGYGLRTASGTLTACDACRTHHAAESGEIPDGYAAGIAALRNASSTPSTPESRFAARYQAERTTEFEQDQMDVDEYITATSGLPRLTAAELAEFEPPNGYQIALEGAKR